MGRGGRRRRRGEGFPGEMEKGEKEGEVKRGKKLGADFQKEKKRWTVQMKGEFRWRREIEKSRLRI